MTPAVKELLFRDTFTPLRLGGNAAVYSPQGAPSEKTYILAGGLVPVVADQSGNSAVNGLVIQGTNSNTASTPDSAAISLVGDQSIAIRCSLVSFTAGATVQVFLNHDATTAGQRGVIFYLQTDGKLNLFWSTTGTGGTNKAATAALTNAAFSTIWLLVSFDVDNGAAGNDIKFYWAPDSASLPTSWTPVGNTVTTAVATSVYNTPQQLIIGNDASNVSPVNGVIYRAVYFSGVVASDGTGGTIVLDENFTLQAKTFTTGSGNTFVESSVNAATVTINSTGDLGARIGGARDRVQLTVAKQPAFSTGADGINILTYDGSNDYMKSAPFPLVQPTSVYFGGSPTTWTDNDYIVDGFATHGGAIIQTTTTPNISINAGIEVAENTGFVLGVRAVVSAIINGASSFLGINTAAQTTGNAGAANMGGITVGARGAGDAGFWNGTESMMIVRSAADSASLKNRVVGWFKRKLKIT